MSGRLTPGSSVDQLKQEARRWLKALRAGASAALDRFEAALPDFNRVPGLRDVQHALARELGFPGWIALKDAVARRRNPPDTTETLVARFLDNACPDHHVRGGSDHVRAQATAMRLLAQHPSLAHASFVTRVVCGDLDAVRREVAEHRELATIRDDTPSIARAGAGNAGDLVRQDWGTKGWTALLYHAFTRLPIDATNENAIAIMRALLDAGADPNAYFMAGDSRYTPLVGVIGEGEEGRPSHPHRDALVQLLMERGADPFDGQVLYNIHFRDNVLWYLKLAHESSVHRGDVSKWDDPSWPMLDMWGHGSGARWILELAIQHGNAALAKWCLEHGADANAPPPASPHFLKRSLYEEAMHRGSGAIAKLLQEHGARVVPVTLDLAEQLTAAAFRLDRAGVHDLVAQHPELRQSPDALFEAARRNRADVIAVLLDAGISVDTAGGGNEVALHQAVYHNSLDAATLLIERGADVNILGTIHNNTPLGAAVYGRNWELIDLIAPRSRDIWELVYGGKVDRVRELVAENAEFARATGGGHTLLMWLPPDDEDAALEIARLLLDNGADATVRNNDGMTAAVLAERIGMLTVAALLRTAETPTDTRPTLARYEQMAQNLLDAYRTGTIDAMQRHWHDTWHRRAWPAMRRYVLLDLGRTPGVDDAYIDISLDDAQMHVAREQRFATWQELTEFVGSLPPDKRRIATRPVELFLRADNGRRSDRVSTRDWDAAIEALSANTLNAIDGHGQMTDDALAMLAYLPHLTTLDMGGSKHLTDAGLGHLARMPQLRNIDLRGTQVTDSGLKVFHGLTALESIDLSGTQVTDAGIAELADCTALRRVELGSTRTGDGAIRAFAEKTALRHLVTGMEVTDAGIALLHRLPVFKTWQGGMTVLELTSPGAEPNMLVLRGNFTDRGLAQLVGLDGLFGLDLDDSKLAITGKGLAPLVALANLGKLSFDAHDDAMPFIARMPALRFVGIQDTDATNDGWIALAASQTIEGIWGRRCYGLGSRGFRALATMPSLRDLSVSCKNVDDDAIAMLPTFPSLRQLMPMDIPDAGYRHIGRCDDLEALTLMYCRDTGDEATSHITGLRKLRRYFASYTRATDRTPELLSGLDSLEEIDIESCNGITNDGIVALARLPRLRQLTLGGMRGVTPEVVGAFTERVTVQIS